MLTLNNGKKLSHSQVKASPAFTDGYHYCQIAERFAILHKRRLEFFFSEKFAGKSGRYKFVIFSQIKKIARYIIFLNMLYTA